VLSTPSRELVSGSRRPESIVLGAALRQNHWR
jgi:hypothetical protein